MDVRCRDGAVHHGVCRQGRWSWLCTGVLVASRGEASKEEGRHGLGLCRGSASGGIAMEERCWPWKAWVTEMVHGQSRGG